MFGHILLQDIMHIVLLDRFAGSLDSILVAVLAETYDIWPLHDVQVGILTEIPCPIALFRQAKYPLRSLNIYRPSGSFWMC